MLDRLLILSHVSLHQSQHKVEVGNSLDQERPVLKSAPCLLQISLVNEK